MRSLTDPAERRRAGRRDREGGSTAIEFVIWTPLLLIILLALAQLALVLFAQHVADTAAQAGARAGRQDEPTDPKGWTSVAATTADNWVNGLVGDAVKPDTLKTLPVFNKAPNACTPPTVTVQVSFQMSSLLGSLTARGQSQGPVENFYPEC